MSRVRAREDRSGQRMSGPSGRRMRTCVQSGAGTSSGTTLSGVGVSNNPAT